MKYQIVKFKNGKYGIRRFCLSNLLFLLTRYEFLNVEKPENYYREGRNNVGEWHAMDTGTLSFIQHPDLEHVKRCARAYEKALEWHNADIENAQDCGEPI